MLPSKHVTYDQARLHPKASRFNKGLNSAVARNSARINQISWKVHSLKRLNVGKGARLSSKPMQWLAKLLKLKRGPRGNNGHHSRYFREICPDECTPNLMSSFVGSRLMCGLLPPVENKQEIICHTHTHCSVERM